MRRAREFRIKLSEIEWTQTRMLMHICTSDEVFHPRALASPHESHFQFPLVGAKTSFSPPPPTMAARRAKHAKNEELSANAGKVIPINLFSNASLVVVAMLVDVISSHKIPEQATYG